MKKTALIVFTLITTSSALACGYGNIYPRVSCTLSSPGLTPAQVELSGSGGTDIAALDLPRVAKANIEVTVNQKGASVRTSLRGKIDHFQTYTNETRFTFPVECDVPVTVFELTRELRDVSNSSKTVTLNCSAISYFDAD